MRVGGSSGGGSGSGGSSDENKRLGRPHDSGEDMGETLDLDQGPVDDHRDWSVCSALSAHISAS